MFWESFRFPVQRVLAAPPPASRTGGAPAAVDDPGRQVVTTDPTAHVGVSNCLNHADRGERPKRWHCSPTPVRVPGRCEADVRHAPGPRRSQSHPVPVRLTLFCGSGDWEYPF